MWWLSTLYFLQGARHDDCRATGASHLLPLSLAFGSTRRKGPRDEIVRKATLAVFRGNFEHQPKRAKKTSKHYM